MQQSSDFLKMKNENKKISMVTSYDYWSAKIIDKSHIDAILVGDSAAMVMHGHKDTTSMNIDIMALHTKAVSLGAPHKFIVGDLPFLSFRKDLFTNMSNVEKIIQSGAQAIKLEGADGNLELVKHLVESGIPVMGHLGLTPQFVHQFGGFKVQGRQIDKAQKIVDDAKLLEQMGCFALVLECVPSPLARKISLELEIPTIGIGAGPDTDGQILVLQDMLGMSSDFKPKFLRKFLKGEDILLDAFNAYQKAVSEKDFPSIEESYE